MKLDFTGRSTPPSRRHFSPGIRVSHWLPRIGGRRTEDAQSNAGWERETDARFHALDALIGDPCFGATSDGSHTSRQLRTGDGSLHLGGVATVSLARCVSSP
jgi:hypothetical protein